MYIHRMNIHKLMDQLCRMAYFGEEVVEELQLEQGSFEEIWKQYDAYEPQPVPELKKLYIPANFGCSGVWSFLAEVFPNCTIHALEFSELSS